MLTIKEAIVVEGEYNGKPYKSGRLVTCTFRNNSKNPAFVKLEKCSAEIAEQLKSKLPLMDADILYDQYRNIVSVKPKS